MAFTCKKYTVMEDEAGIRLDRLLLAKIPTLSQGLLQKAIRHKDVKLNNRKASTSMRLIVNDIITYPHFWQEVRENKPDIDSRNLNIFKNCIIHEDENLIAIDKPYGWHCQGGNNIADATTVDKIALAYHPQLRLVHRLDKTTTGVLIMAKGRQNAIQLTKLFANRAVKKEYLAIIPKFDATAINTKGEINQPIANKQALTRYELVKNIRNDKYSLIKLFPQTGRKHQLRIHLQYLGYPIVGDKKYGSKHQGKLLLHAHKIMLSSYVFTAKTPTWNKSS